MASSFVRTDGEAASDEKTSKERMDLDLAADDVELKSAASRRSVPPGGITGCLASQAAETRRL